MASQLELTLLLQKLNDVNEEVGAEYELRRLEAVHCGDFNRNRVCTKPDHLAKKLTRQLVIEDGVQDNVQIERMITELQQKAEARAEETAKLDKLVAFWSGYMVDFIKDKTAFMSSEDPSSIVTADAVVNPASDATGNTAFLATDSTVAVVSPTIDDDDASVSVTEDNGGNC